MTDGWSVIIGQLIIYRLLLGHWLANFGKFNVAWRHSTARRVAYDASKLYKFSDFYNREGIIFREEFEPRTSYHGRREKSFGCLHWSLAYFNAFLGFYHRNKFILGFEPGYPPKPVRNPDPFSELTKTSTLTLSLKNWKPTLQQILS